MTRKEYESQAYVERRVRLFRQRAGHGVTADEAIQTIRAIRREILFPPGKNWPKREAAQRSIERFAAEELILKIADNMDEDPIRIAYEYWSWLDDMHVEGNTGKCWAFVCDMKNAIEDIVELMRVM